MKNSLFKRLKRELLKDLPKYIVMFLFLAMPIALCSGYMIGNDSMIKTYYNSIETYNLEDGHFSTMFMLNEDKINDIENENDITIFNLNYKEVASENGHIARIYKLDDRLNVNKWCLHKGEIPDDEIKIALDRLYCENNDIKIGDIIYYNSKPAIVSGYISLFDYSCLFKNNTDSMFNAQTFTIALVSDEGYTRFSSTEIYNYAYTYPKRLNETDAHNKTIDLKKNIYKFCALNGNTLNDFISSEENQAIQFSIEDMEGDLTMMLIFGAIIIVGLAFVFALSIKSQIEEECHAVGTLKALGYTNKEVLFHYLILPLIVVLFAAAAGNILSYTLLKDYIVTLYYHSYSLPLYTTFFNLDALIYTTIVPVIIVLIINFAILNKSIKLPILNLLSANLKKQKNKKITKLSPKIPFMSRFRLRVVLQNKGTYFALFMGTLLSCIILFFGLMMNPILTHYKQVVIEDQIAPYQTIMKRDTFVSEYAEKVLLKQLVYENDDIMIYGVEKTSSDSKYFKNLSFENNKVVINSSIKNKYKIKTGQTITIDEKYSEEKYTFTVSKTYDNSGSLIIFMDTDMFLSTFDDGEYLVTYFSDVPLAESTDIYKVISTEDLTMIADQLADSMGDLFLLFTIFSGVLFALLIYLLSKIVIEKNQKQISMMKIIGYKTSEINFAYNIPTGIMVILSVIVGTLLSHVVIKVLWEAILRIKMKGWLDFYIAPYIYPLIILIALICYGVVYFVESKKINKIELSYTLKEGNI